MADATDSKSVSRKGVWVRVPPPVLGAVPGSTFGPVTSGGIPVSDSRTPRCDLLVSSCTSHWNGNMGYVVGMFAVVVMIGVGLGVVFTLFGGNR